MNISLTGQRELESELESESGVLVKYMFNIQSYISRHPVVFSQILNYYRTGGLDTFNDD